MFCFREHSTGKAQASLTAFYNYTNKNIDKIYNGEMMKAIRDSFPHRARRSYTGLVTLYGNIIQKNGEFPFVLYFFILRFTLAEMLKKITLIPLTASAGQLNDFFQCNTTYQKYDIQTNDTAIYCISPCASDKNHCNGGTCSHTASGPKCTCGKISGIYQSTGDRCQDSTILTDAFYKILFGTLAGILGLALLLGLIVYCIKRRSHSDSVNLLNDNNSIASDAFNKPGKFSKSGGFPWISNIPETKLDANMLPKVFPVSWQPKLDRVDTNQKVQIERPTVIDNPEYEDEVN
uniref:EGF-like domain-containing protein n=1 Tax=Eptatretus burgeri TaxID=7764 RepID=A0A8C4N648_EPTBU